jgi:hypothetical protein
MLVHKTREKKISIIHKHISNFILVHIIKFQLLIISKVLTLVQNLSDACLKCLMKLNSDPFPATSWSCNRKRINLHELNKFHVCPTSTQDLVAAPSILHECITTRSIAWVGHQNHWKNEHFEWKHLTFCAQQISSYWDPPTPKVMCLKFVTCDFLPQASENPATPLQTRNEIQECCKATEGSGVQGYS